MAVGGHQTHHGSGGNYVCMPLDPDYDASPPGSSHAIIYGAEYEYLGKHDKLIVDISLLEIFEILI